MIINADDFGRTPAINRAVVQAFEHGLVSSTTLMATMPGFDDACAVAHERGLAAHVGVHLVLTDGEPLTTAMRASRRFCDRDGRFLRREQHGRDLWLAAGERRLLADELRAQILRCRAAGLPVTHVDSHHNMHNQLAIGGVVIAVARELEIPSVRVAENLGALTRLHRASAAYLNTRMRRFGLARTRWFAAVHGYLGDRRRPDDVELMTHPALDAEGALLDAEYPGVKLADLLAPVPGHRSAVSFAGARYAAVV